ncbi:hypothetical protein [Ammoniphilus sp. CFH 90114]|uniref:hypothetical protein n=1 Tax=Ammoniphilus sp. CFH 90114 TaxID=2493665 RepID=UPI0013E92623|nr:hypothetical protein [Ammoniphilus sp. CFH 90114]
MGNFYIMEKMAEEKVKELQQSFYMRKKVKVGVRIANWINGFSFVKKNSDCCEVGC